MLSKMEMVCTYRAGVIEGVCHEKTALSEGTICRAFLLQPANALHRHPQRKASASSAHVA